MKPSWGGWVPLWTLSDRFHGRPLLNNLNEDPFKIHPGTGHFSHFLLVHSAMNNLSHIRFLGIFRNNDESLVCLLPLFFLQEFRVEELPKLAWQATNRSEETHLWVSSWGGNILTNNFDHGTPECLTKSRHLQIQERKWFIDHLRNHVGDRYPGAFCMKIAMDWNVYQKTN